MSTRGIARLACVDVPALPLQLLLRREPTWARHPVVVVERDEPLGRILWVNERARRARVLPGRRYSEALSLAPDLRAGVVEAAEIDAAVDAIAARLGAFSPDVEAQAGEPGVLFVDARGLEGVFASLERWAGEIVEALRGDGFVASVVVGFTRFDCHAIARSRAGVELIDSPTAERRRADGVRLDRLGIAPKLRDALQRLGVETVGGLRRLPPGGLLERFGSDAHRLHEAALGRRSEPLAPRRPAPPIAWRYERDPEDPRLDLQGLVSLVAQGLVPIGSELARRGEALALLHLSVLLDDGGSIDRHVEPAAPTLDQTALLGLARLRLEGLGPRFASGKDRDPTRHVEIEGLALRADGVPATREQLALFAEAPRRDLRAADRALARLRAELGDDAIVRAVLRSGHLPDARFRWERLTNLPLAVVEPARPQLVRRILRRPLRTPQQRPGPDGWMPAGLEVGAVRAMHGPFIVSGGWWAGEQHREYHFAEARRGDVLWLYFERLRRCWYLQGCLE